jgi:hypothetical protein
LNKKGVTNWNEENLKEKKDPLEIGLSVDERINPKFKVGENTPKLTKIFTLLINVG